MWCALSFALEEKMSEIVCICIGLEDKIWYDDGGRIGVIYGKERKQ